VVLNSDLKSIRSKGSLAPLHLVLYAQTCIGVVLGSWFVGVKNLMPWNSQWLMPTPNRLDHAVAQLNWEFFRNAPIFQWPPVLIPSLGEGWGTVYVPFSSGSLFGIVLKYFDVVLPQDFQFLGIWVLFSFAMLGYWSVRLVSRVTSRPGLLWLGSSLLMASPTIFYRIGVLGHFELSAHWLIFAAIWLYLTEGFSGRRWALLCTVTLIVNVYLFAIVFGVFLASVISHLVFGSERRRIIQWAVVMVGLTFVNFAVFGFLEYRENAQGLGFFRSNALSLLYPNFALGGSISGSFSRFFDMTGVFTNRPFIAFEREGFNYLGSGVIIGLVIAVALLAVNFRRIPWSKLSSFVPLLVLSVFFYLNSISNQVAVGRREIVDIPLPSFLLEVRQIFRTAERFVWLLSYSLVLLVVASVVYWVRSIRIATAILGVLLAIQIVDSSAGIAESRRALHQQSSVEQLSEESWERVVAGRSEIVFVPTFDFISDSDGPEVESWLENSRFFPLLKLAARKDLATNFSVTGRPVTGLVEAENMRLDRELESGKLHKTSIFVFAMRESWNEMRTRLGDKAHFEILDGYFIMYSKP
jgi:Family of unknown function (DUF6311)